MSVFAVAEGSPGAGKSVCAPVDTSTEPESPTAIAPDMWCIIVRDLLDLLLEIAPLEPVWGATTDTPVSGVSVVPVTAMLSSSSVSKVCRICRVVFTPQVGGAEELMAREEWRLYANGGVVLVTSGTAKGQPEVNSLVFTGTGEDLRLVEWRVGPWEVLGGSDLS